MPDVAGNAGEENVSVAAFESLRHRQFGDAVFLAKIFAQEQTVDPGCVAAHDHVLVVVGKNLRLDEVARAEQVGDSASLAHRAQGAFPETLAGSGVFALKLFAASSAPDTDFTAKLVDLRPDGYAQNVAEGVIRARYRESLSSPTLITPEKVYEYTVDLWATSHVFLPGHSVRLEISSSNFPRFDRNLNTGEDQANWTLSVGLAEFRTLHQVQWNLTMAATILFMAPVIAIFFAAQKAFVEGVTLTGVKG